MAEVVATDTLPSTPSAPSIAPPDNSTPVGPPARKSGATNFLKPQSPRKRRRSVESPNQLPPSLQDLGTSPSSPKSAVSPPTLTAAQALIDQRKQRRDQEIIQGHQTSPNPASRALGALLGAQMSSAKEPENVVGAANAMSDAIADVTPSIQIPDTTQVGSSSTMQTSPTSVTSFSTMEGTAATMIDSNGASVASPGRIDETTGQDEQISPRGNTSKLRRQETDPDEARSNKAMTFPGPLPNFSQSDRRRNTHSGFGRESPSKSPSTKKHQCEIGR